MDIRLVVTTGKHAGKALPITRNKFFIGRSPQCQLTLSSDSVSRHHCAILVGKGIVAVHDLGSRNGTYLNGEKVERQKRLRAGDKLRLGPLEFEFRLAGEADQVSKPEAQPAPAAASDDDVLRWLGEAEERPAGRRAGAAAAKPDVAAASVEQGPAYEADQEAEDDRPADVSEDEKEKRRVHRDIVGVSKAAQARRTSDTARNAAAEAMRKLSGGRRSAV